MSSVGLLGAFPHSAGLAAPPGSTTVAGRPDGSSVAWVSGAWHAGELRTVQRDNGSVTVVGQCFADDGRLTADAEQALATGEWAALTRWPGSYLVIMVRGDELIAITDLAGQYPLYYVPVAGRVVFGSQARATACAAALRPRPDLLMIAAEIFCPATPLLTENRSVVAGVSRLGAGELLHVRGDGQFRKFAYETLAPRHELSPADAARTLGAALDNAVHDRARAGRPLTADFSGGHDSTTVAFLAARHLGRPLRVFTYHHPETPAGDLEYARRYACLDDRLRLDVVLGDGDTLTYQDLPSGRTDVPDPAAVSWPRTRLRLRRVAEHGTGVHLGGEGADSLLVSSPAYLADLANRRMVRRLTADVGNLARRRAESPASLMTSAVRLSRLPMHTALRQLARQLEQPMDRPTQWRDTISWWPAPGVECRWLARSMRRQLAEFVDAAATRPHRSEGHGVADIVALGELRASAAVQRRLTETAREFGVWPQAPFLDNDVIRACTALPAYRRADPATTKPLLRAAMAGRVPAEVFARRTKGNYSGEDYRGARRAASALRARIARSPLADGGVIDPDAVIASLDQARTGMQVPIATLNRVLGADLWLAAWEVSCIRS